MASDGSDIAELGDEEGVDAVAVVLEAIYEYGIRFSFSHAIFVPGKCNSATGRHVICYLTGCAKPLI